MAYVPRKKELKLSYKIALVFLGLVVILGTTVYFSHKEEETQSLLCNFSIEKSKEILEKQYEQTYGIEDYFYYGESLNLYHETYDLGKSDDLTGKTVKIVNLCSKEEYTFIMESSLDRQLIMYDLDDGVYEVFVIDNMVEKRAVYTNTLEKNEFFTASRNGNVRRIELLAGKDSFGKTGYQIQDNYLFLKLDTEKENDEIDVLLDPFGMNMDVTFTPDAGSEGNGLLENDEMYEAALLLKSELEKYGLRVAISKDSKNQQINAYGENGRLYKGYQGHAKYYILMCMNTSTSDQMQGISIMHSRYAGASIEKGILYHLSKNLDIKTDSSVSYDYDNPGLARTTLVEGMDGKVVYENNLYLRESGGRGTGAAMYSENSKQMNEAFAKDANGMKGMEIDFGYVSNEEDAQFWKTHKEEMIQIIAESFAKSIHAEG